MESSNEVIVAAIIVAAAVALIALITALIVKLFGSKDDKGIAESNEESYKDQVDAYLELGKKQQTAAENKYDDLYEELEGHEDNKKPSGTWVPPFSANTTDAELETGIKHLKEYTDSVNDSAYTLSSKLINYKSLAGCKATHKQLQNANKQTEDDMKVVASVTDKLKKELDKASEAEKVSIQLKIKFNNAHINAHKASVSLTLKTSRKIISIMGKAIAVGKKEKED